VQAQRNLVCTDVALIAFEIVGTLKDEKRLSLGQEGRRRSRPAVLKSPQQRRYATVSSRAMGMTPYFEQTESFEIDEEMAMYEISHTTELYDRGEDQITLEKVEKTNRV
jgi:hypothetical protein